MGAFFVFDPRLKSADRFWPGKTDCPGLAGLEDRQIGNSFEPFVGGGVLTIVGVCLNQAN
jgi:hypothetical protein